MATNAEDEVKSEPLAEEVKTEETADGVRPGFSADLAALDSLPLDLSAMKDVFPIVKMNIQELERQQSHHQAEIDALRASNKMAKTRLTDFSDAVKRDTNAALATLTENNKNWSNRAMEGQMIIDAEQNRKLAMQNELVAQIQTSLASKADRLEMLQFLDSKANREDLRLEADGIFRQAQTKWDEQEQVIADHIRNTDSSVDFLKALIEDTEERTKREFTGAYSDRLRKAEELIVTLEAQLGQAAAALAAQKAANPAREAKLEENLRSTTALTCREVEDRLSHKQATSNQTNSDAVSSLEAKLEAQLKATSAGAAQEFHANMVQSLADVSSRVDAVEVAVTEFRRLEAESATSLVRLDGNVSANAASLADMKSRGDAIRGANGEAIASASSKVSALESAVAANSAGREAFEKLAAARSAESIAEMRTKVDELAATIGQLQKDVEGLGAVTAEGIVNLDERVTKISADMSLMCSKDYCEEYCDEATSALRTSVKTISQQLEECRQALAVLGEKEMASSRTRLRKGSKTPRTPAAVRNAAASNLNFATIGDASARDRRRGGNDYGPDMTEDEYMLAERRRLKSRGQDASPERIPHQ